MTKEDILLYLSVEEENICVSSKIVLIFDLTFEYSSAVQFLPEKIEAFISNNSSSSLTSSSYIAESFLPPPTEDSTPISLGLGL
jgi:hypothetical protein